jgi:hypothetical protein
MGVYRLLNLGRGSPAGGDWSDAGEQIFTDRAVIAGANALSLTAPPGAVAGNTVGRFRLGTAGGLSFTWLASDGEVEDHLIQIDSSRDLEIAVGDTSRWSATSP